MLQADLICSNVQAWIASRQAFIDANARPEIIGVPDDAWALTGEVAVGVCWFQEKVVPGEDGSAVIGGAGEMVTLELAVVIRALVLVNTAASVNDPERGAGRLAADLLSKVDGLRRADVGFAGIGTCVLGFVSMTVVPHPSREPGAAGPAAIVIRFVTSAFEQ